MRILLLNWKDPLAAAAGGSERYVRAVAETWAAAGHHVEVVNPRVEGRPDRETIAGVSYRRMGTFHTVYAHARHYLRQDPTRFDKVLESVSTRPFLAHRIVGDRATAIVYHVAGPQWDREFGFPMNRIGRMILEPFWLRHLRRCRVLTISHSTAAQLARLGVIAEEIIPPGCEMPAAHLSPRLTLPPRIVVIGRLVRAKRPEDAVEAFRQLRQRWPGATLDVIGTGYLEQPLRDRAEPGVVVHGFVSEESKSEILSRAHALLMPATAEGWGIAAMEAAAHGVPAIAYRIPGLRDCVDDGVTGILTKATPSGLVSGATRVLEDPELWSAMSANGKRRAEGFTWRETSRRVAQAMDFDGLTATGSAPLPAISLRAAGLAAIPSEPA